jgi:hypothetical protein
MATVVRRLTGRNRNHVHKLTGGKISAVDQTAEHLAARPTLVLQTSSARARRCLWNTRVLRQSGDCTGHLPPRHATRYWLERQMTAALNRHDTTLPTVRVSHFPRQSTGHEVKALLASLQKVRIPSWNDSNTLNSRLISRPTKTTDRLTKWISSKNKMDRPLVVCPH